MIFQVYESDEFIGGRESEQRILYFESRKGKNQIYNTFEEFIKACMVFEQRFDSPCLCERLNIREIESKIDISFHKDVHTIPNEDFLHNKELSHFSFHEALIDCSMKYPKNIIKCVSVYEQEWNYLFHVVECDIGYFGFNWSTSA